jgi:hypothetical protein
MYCDSWCQPITQTNVSLGLAKVEKKLRGLAQDDLDELYKYKEFNMTESVS